MPAPATRPEASAPPDVAGWSPRQLLAQPHRLSFTAAALVWAASAVGWLLALIWPTPMAGGVPAGTLHALAFTLGPMPLFFAGFLFTSAPKWLRRPELPARALAPGVVAFTLGWLLWVVIGAWSVRGGAFALMLCCAGWMLLWLRLLSLRRGATRGSGHFDAITLACGLIGLALAAAALALGVDRVDAVQAIARMALWGAVLPVFLLASHRLLPFLAHADAPQAQSAATATEASATDAAKAVKAVKAADAAVAADAAHADAASHPRWVPALPLAASLLMALLAWPGLPATWVVHAWPLRLLLAAAAATLTLWLAWRWRAHPATRAPLLHRLLRAFSWSGAAWLALAVAAVPGLPVAWPAALESAAVHAMALGFAGGTFLTMVTRLSAAQAGQARAVDALTRRADQLLQLALAARLLAALWPLLAPASWPRLAPAALPLAALLWAWIALAWLWRHARLAGQARPGRTAPRP